MTSALHVVLPAGIDDPAAPSGGNRYDREVLDQFKIKFDVPVREIALPGSWPQPESIDRDRMSRALAEIPDGATVLLDGLVACGVPEILEPHAARLRLVVLVHLPLSDETGLTPSRAAELRALERRTLHLAAGVIATSDQAAAHVAAMHDLVKVHVAAPGVNRAESATPSPTGHRLLCVASLTPRKGQDLLLSALSQLTDLNWECTFVGAGTIPPIPAALAEAASIAHAPTLAASTTHAPTATAGPPPAAPPPLFGQIRKIRFAGALAGAELDAAYANADLFVLPSRAETYGMVITEALARALPVVATEVGGVPEALGTVAGDLGARGESSGQGQGGTQGQGDALGGGALNGVPGTLLGLEDLDGLTATLRDWLTDADLRERWRGRALARRETLTGWDGTARRLTEILNAIEEGTA